MTIAKYRPGQMLVSPLNELINEFFGYDDVPQRQPGVNIVECKEDFKIDLLAPGFTREDLKIVVENDVLTISGEKKMEDLKEGERYSRREFSYNTFKRSFRLPELLDGERIRAEYLNGVLSVTVPKREVTRPATREIAIG